MRHIIYLITVVVCVLGIGLLAAVLVSCVRKVRLSEPELEGLIGESKADIVSKYGRPYRKYYYESTAINTADHSQKEIEEFYRNTYYAVYEYLCGLPPRKLVIEFNMKGEVGRVKYGKKVWQQPQDSK